MMNVDEKIDGSSAEGIPDEPVESASSPVESDKAELKKKMMETLDPAERAKRKLAELAAKKEAGEISKFAFDHEYIYELQNYDCPLTRKDLDVPTGPQALVLTYDDMQALGHFEYLAASGEIKSVDPDAVDPDDVFILYPEELGNPKPKQEPLVEKKETETVGAEARMKRVLLDIFGDIAFDEPVTRNADWEEILRIHQKMIFGAVQAGRAKGIPETYLRSFIFARLDELVDARQYESAADALKNLHCGTAEQQEEFAKLAALARAEDMDKKKGG